MKGLKFISLLITVCIWSTQASLGQIDCSITLKNAQKQYDDGVIERVPAMLASCLKSGFSKEEKLQALKLLTLTYLFEDKVTQAEEGMMKILKIDPEYEVNEAVDPIEFINLHNSFRTEAIYTFGLRGGINYSSSYESEPFGVGDIADYPGQYLSNGPAFQITAAFGRHVIQGLMVNLEPTYMVRKIRFGTRILEVTSITAQETQSWFSIPLSISYDLLRKSKLQPFVHAGFDFGILLSSSSILERGYLDPGSAADVTGPEVDISYLRNSNNYWLTGGVGAKYKINKGHFILHVSYLRGLGNQAYGNHRYSNFELLYKYYYVDQDFFIDNLTFSLGYSYSLYNPKLKVKPKAD